MGDHLVCGEEAGTEEEAGTGEQLICGEEAGAADRPIGGEEVGTRVECWRSGSLTESWWPGSLALASSRKVAYRSGLLTS